MGEGREKEVSRCLFPRTLSPIVFSIDLCCASEWLCLLRRLMTPLSERDVSMQLID